MKIQHDDTAATLSLPSENDLAAYAQEYSSSNVVKLVGLEQLCWTNSRSSEPYKIVATWASVKFPGIEAQSSANLQDLSTSNKAPEENRVWVRDFLVSRGYQLVRDENRAYQAKLAEVRLSQEKKETLLALGARVRSVAVSEPFMESQPFRYQVTLDMVRGESDDVFFRGTSTWHENVHVAFDDAKAKYEESKLREEEGLLKRKADEPEYYYAKSGIQETLNKFSLYISMRDVEDGLHSVTLERRYDAKGIISAVGYGSSYEEAFADAIGKVDPSLKDVQDDKRHFFDVTHLETGEVADMLDFMHGSETRSHDENVAFYRSMLLRTLNRAIEHKGLLTPDQEENIQNYWNGGLDTEDYEFLKAVQQYGEQKQVLFRLQEALASSDMSLVSKEECVAIQKQALKDKNYTLAARIEINLGK